MQKSKHGMTKFSRRKNLGVGLKSKILRIHGDLVLRFRMKYFVRGKIFFIYFFR